MDPMPDQLDREPPASPLIGCLTLTGVMSIAGLCLVGLYHLMFG
jgi:hypothetical protein